jgi:hypothetical protein
MFIFTVIVGLYYTNSEFHRFSYIFELMRYALQSGTKTGNKAKQWR